MLKNLLEQWFSKCGSQSSNIRITQEVKNAYSQAHPRPAESEALG